MRETLELVITQSKEISQTPAKSADAIALFEEATSSRSMLARDDYDARAWKEQVADMREQMAVNGKVVLSAVNETSANPSPDICSGEQCSTVIVAATDRDKTNSTARNRTKTCVRKKWLKRLSQKITLRSLFLQPRRKRILSRLRRHRKPKLQKIHRRSTPVLFCRLQPSNPRLFIRPLPRTCEPKASSASM